MTGFVEHRELLLGVAYRVLGRVADAEDVVQEAWLRWSKTDDGSVRDPEAYLVKVTTRLAIDRLRRVQSRRETYVGEWLPEPLLTPANADAAADAADEVVRAESVSMALLVVLETLSPLERAVFVLHDIFETPYAEVSAALGKAEPAVRQLASRARTHVRERRPRFDVDPGTWREVTDRFIAVCLTGGVEDLVDLLAPDVQLFGDSGGHARAPRRVVRGSDKVARFLLGILTPKKRAGFLSSLGVDTASPVNYQLVTANGGPALVLATDGRPLAYFQLQITDGKVSTFYLVVNPAKLTGVMAPYG